MTDGNLAERRMRGQRPIRPEVVHYAVFFAGPDGSKLEFVHMV
jgi:hypothetical protein